MKHALLVVLVMLFASRPVFGQTEKIALYADAGGSDCSVTDTAPGLVEVHIIHHGSGGRKGSRFIAPKPECWTGAIWLGDNVSEPVVFIGNTQTDFTVLYILGFPCAYLPRYVGKINYFGIGTGQSCCEYPVLPAPGSEIPGSVVTIDCDPPPFGKVIAIGAGSVTINENSNCPCDPPLAVEETTWGRVKALYK